MKCHWFNHNRRTRDRLPPSPADFNVPSTSSSTLTFCHLNLFRHHYKIMDVLNHRLSAAACASTARHSLVRSHDCMTMHGVCLFRYVWFRTQTFRGILHNSVVPADHFLASYIPVILVLYSLLMSSS